MTNVSLFIVTLSRVSMLPLVILYVLGIVAISIVILALFKKYNSLRDTRKKRNILIYCVFALILALLIFNWT